MDQYRGAYKQGLLAQPMDMTSFDPYAPLAAGLMLAPGSGFADVAGYAPSMTTAGEYEPSMMANIGSGQYLDAGLQGLGLLGDAFMAAGTVVPPLIPVGAAMKLPRAGRVASAADVFSEVKDFPNLTKSEERVVAASSAPPEQVAGLGRVVTEPIDPQNMAASKARFDQLQKATSGYEQERAKARIVWLDDGTDAIQYMEPPATVQSVPISQLKATQPGLLSGGDAPLTEGPPLVVKKGGEFFVRDGHHRLARMIEAGADTADVRVVDLDAGGLLGVETSSRGEDIAALRRQANIERFGYDPNDAPTGLLDEPDVSYRMQHQPRGPEDDLPVRLDDLTKSTTGEAAGFPDDFYSSIGKRTFAPGPRFDNDEYGIAGQQSYRAISSVRGNPNAEVTIYRGVPNDPDINTINRGDFVTLSPKYAELHAASGYGRSGDEAGKVISQKVKVKDIYWDGNDVNEFGFFPSKKK